MSGPNENLSTTSFAVLGLLTFGEMSGYDVLKLAEASIGHFWAPAKSHVYAELKRLESAGLASARKVDQEGRPNKTLYKITSRGEEALRTWLLEPVAPIEPPKSVFTLKLFFGRLIPHHVLVEQVEDMKKRCEAMLQELLATETKIKNDDSLFYPYLTLKAGLAHARAAVSWADEVLGLLRTKQKQEVP